MHQKYPWPNQTRFGLTGRVHHPVWRYGQLHDTAEWTVAGNSHHSVQRYAKRHPAFSSHPAEANEKYNPSMITLPSNVSSVKPQSHSAARYVVKLALPLRVAAFLLDGSLKIRAMLPVIRSEYRSLQIRHQHLLCESLPLYECCGQCKMGLTMSGERLT